MREMSRTFLHQGVATAYQHRPPYPEETLDLLCGLVKDPPGQVLDLGAGEGALCRPLASRMTRVDAVEISAAMVAVGRARPGGDASNLVWHVTAAETMELAGPFGLVTAGASLHWMDRSLVLARVARVLVPDAVLCVVEHGFVDLPWATSLREVIVRHSRTPGYDPTFSVAADLTRQGFWEFVGQHTTKPQVIEQRIEDYIEQFHSTASLARELMSGEEAQTFDESVRAIVSPFATANGTLELPVSATAIWGRPFSSR